MHINAVTSEGELDAVERPVRDAFADFLRGIGLFGTEETVVGLTFKTGMLHFAVKALEFVPDELTVLLVGAGLTDEEVAFLSAAGRHVFNFDQAFDNELVYEMLMDFTAGTFGWVDADCFVLNTDAWKELTSRPGGRVGSSAAFTYAPLGFAKTPLVFWSREARSLLKAESTTLNSYAPIVTQACRISPYAISRILSESHFEYLEKILVRGSDQDFRPHDGLLDIYDGNRTVTSRLRTETQSWLGSDSTRTGWLIDTPMMAEIVLRAHGFATHQVFADNRQITHEVIHVGASGYRERLRKEGFTAAYLQRYRLTDLFEILLADELVSQGLELTYAELSAIQKARLRDEAGIAPDEIKAEAQAILGEAGLDLRALRSEPRMSFLF